MRKLYIISIIIFNIFTFPAYSLTSPLVHNKDNILIQLPIKNIELNYLSKNGKNYEILTINENSNPFGAFRPYVAQAMQVAKEKRDDQVFAKLLTQAIKLVDESARFAKGDKDLFIKQILDDLNQRIMGLIAHNPAYVQQPELMKKLGNIGDLLIETIKTTQNNGEISAMLASYFYIVDNPAAFIK